MAKYKVGDKVRIVSERPSSRGFTDTMCKYLGTVMTISKVIESDNPSYKMEEDKGGLEFLLPRVLFGDIADGWIWSEKWISGLAEEPKESNGTSSEPLSVHIRFCGPLTVAELMKGSKVVKVANARRSPKDTYDRGKGAKVAVNRLFEKKHPVNPAKEWNVGDKFRVVLCDSFTQNGDIVTLVEKHFDGINKYKDARGRTIYLAPLRLVPYKETKKLAALKSRQTSW